ncbi:MAG: hypothetical protein LBJ10_00940 [Clostridiales bacterium]|jgi:hypothetical protein|nr:hypothetical protein [Clostridiales bacterium]
MIQLEDGGLSVLIDGVGEAYSGSRFDHCGIVTSLKLEGHEFCGIESAEPGVLSGTGGLGLCGEFGIAEPIGFGEIGPGEEFLKIGVGWLRKTNGEYSQAHPYPIASPGEASCSRDGARGASFVFDSGVRNGYGARCEKTLLLEGGGLSVRYALRNIGEKNIRTTEYCHNFVCIDGLPVDPGYRLATGFSRIDGDLAGLLASGRQPYYALFAGGDLPGGFSGWTLSHRSLATALSEAVSFPVLRFAVWGTRSVLSAECFIDISLAPGESMEWQRRYSFSLAG